MQKEFKSVLKTKSKHSRADSVAASSVRDASRPKSGGTAVRAELDAVKKQNEALLKQVSALQKVNESQKETAK